VIPGMLLVPLTHVIGQRLFGRSGAALAAILTAFSSFAIYYSQETRMYAWVVAFSTLSVYASLRLQRQSSPRTKWSAVFLASTLAAAFTHYYAFLVLLAENLFMIWRKHRQRRWLRRWIGMQAVAGLAFLPWALAHVDFIGGKASARWEALGAGGLDAVWAGTLAAFGAGETVSPLGRWLGIALLVPLAMGLRGALQRSRRERVLAYWLFVPLAAAWLLGPLMPFFFPRYLIVALPAYVLLLAGGLRASARPLVVFWLLLALLANGRSLRNYFSDPNFAKGGYGDLMAYVQVHRQPGDALLLQNGAQAALYDYYGQAEPRAYNMPPWDDAQMQPLLQSVSAQHERIWLLMYGDPVGYDPQHELERWLHQRAFRAFHGDYVGGSLDLFVQGEIVPSSVAEVRFGDVIALSGFGTGAGEHVPAGTLPLALAWRALRPMGRDYTAFVHLLDGEGKLWAQADSQPQGGTRPTSLWQPGETVIDRVALPLGAELPPGEYRLQAGWYQLADMQRLPAVGEGSLPDRAQLGLVTIAAP
ncbi:MAG: glycosyltransferase family 39 protein, partial [Anaerolineales bacterium]|nr:glycosyltransferase family 39 protein [Anaerolineales bacterium]